MIRINLLPRKVTRKKLTVIRHLVLGGLLLLVLLVAMGYTWVSQSGRISALRAQIAAAQQEKDKLKNVNQEKERYQKNIEDLKHRIDVISQIEKGRSLPIHFFDDVTRVLEGSIPVWLTSMGFNGDRVSLDGYSFTNSDIALLVTRLEGTASLRSVELLVSQKVTLQGKEAFKFSISALLETPQGG